MMQHLSQVAAFFKDYYKLVLFTVFNSILPGNFYCPFEKDVLYTNVLGIDLSSDAFTSYGLYVAGHVYWSSLTFLLMWNPVIIHAAKFFHKLYKSSDKYHRRNFDLQKELKSVWIHIPFLLIFKNLYNAIQLWKIDFGRENFDPKNSQKVEEIQHEAGSAGMWESFTEAGPQSILQMVIVFSTGKVSTGQKITIPSSILSLAWASARAFFIQRTEEDSDPDPELLTVLMRVFPWMLVIVFNSVLLWTIIGGLLGGYIFVGVFLCFITIDWSIKVVDWYASKNPSATLALILTQAYAITQVYAFLAILIYAIGVHGSSERQSYIILTAFGLILLGYVIFALVDRRRNMKREEPTYDDSSSSSFFQMKSALTSIWLPCVIGSNGHTFLTSSITSLLNKVLLLALALLVTFTRIVQPNVFLLQCTDRADLNETHLAVCKQPWSEMHPNISSCLETSGQNLTQKVRVCDDDTTEKKIHLYFSLIIFVSTVLCGTASYNLHRIVDNFSFFRRTKQFCFFFKTEPVVLRSLVFSLASDNEKHGDLEEVVKAQPAMASRPRKGETPLHMAAQKGAANCAEVLLKAGAVPVRNGMNEFPEVLHLAVEKDVPGIIRCLINLKRRRLLPDSSIVEMMQKRNQTGKTPLEASTGEPIAELLKDLNKPNFLQRDYFM